MGHGRDTLRTAALVAVGWWVVHQLRYLLAYGAGSGDALHQTGHAYLGPVAPLLGMALVLVFARMVVRAAAAAPAGRSARAQRLIVLWPACAGAIAVLYAVQETTEGMLAAGHPAGLAAIFGHGGWLAVPLAVLVGLAVAAALRVGERLEARAPAGFGGLSAAVPSPAAALVSPAPYAFVPGAPGARMGTCRGPPAAAS